MPILAFGYLRPLNPLKFDAELAVFLLAAHFSTSMRLFTRNGLLGFHVIKSYRS